MGFALGLITWALLNTAYALTDIVWKPVLMGAVPVALVPLLCMAGGAAIGWWNEHFQSAPEPFTEVIDTTRKKGSYKIKRPVPAFVSFVMPLACGGPVGPEAGLTGFIAAGCTRIGAALSRIRARMNGVAAGFSRAEKYVVYGAGVVGGVLGVVAYGAWFGGMGVPRFGIPALTLQAVLWMVPLTLAGMALSGVLRLGTAVFSDIAHHMRGGEVVRAACCGLVLGATATALPYVLFPGTEQMGAVLAHPEQIGAAELALTSVAKMLLLTLCLSFGWHGGPFFPLIFCASCLGLAISLAAGIDPALCVTVTSAALLGRFTRKPGIATAILLLCVPVRGIVWAIIPLLAGALLPTVEELAKEFAARRAAWREI